MPNYSEDFDNLRAANATAAMQGGGDRSIAPKDQIKNEIDEAEERDKNQLMARALIQAIPTIVGYAAYGNRGGAVGAQAGLQGNETLTAANRDLDVRKEKRISRLEDLQQKREALAAQLQQKAEEGQRQREMMKYVADQNADVKRMLAQAQIDKANDKLSPGQQALDRDFAKDYEDFTSGGESRLSKNLDLLKGAREKVAAAAEAEAKGQPSMISGNVVGRLPEFLRSQEARAIQSDVRQASQASLRETLGAQFTEKEGERIMQAAYDPTLSPAENLKKIDRVINELSTTAGNKKEKIAYFENKGTLNGYKSHAGATPVAGATPPAGSAPQNNSMMGAESAVASPRGQQMINDFKTDYSNLSMDQLEKMHKERFGVTSRTNNR